MDRQKANIWWGPPKNFTSQIDIRKISWLELFYDLVYVIAISRVTHIFSAHPGMTGFLDYAYLFIMIFWGWLNGSMYHDLHGSPGIRTRFMTLWQMMSLASFVVCLNDPGGIYSFRPTIALIVMQVFITYLWWSVGIYDASHRKYNKPYTICFIFTSCLLYFSLFLDEPYKRILLWIALALNYLPPFLVIPVLKRENADFSLSSNMVERLGLFTIIVFGECVLGVINGASLTNEYNLMFWLNFVLGILIVFALWWIFFTIIADRESKGGFLNANFIEITYIPTLASLGIIGGCFSVLIFNTDVHTDAYIRSYFGFATCAFLLGITFLSGHLEYPEEFLYVKRTIQKLLVFSGLLAIGVSQLADLSLTTYLSGIFIILLIIVITLTRIWFVVQMKLMEKGPESGVKD